MSTIPQKKIGTRIRRLRERKNISQEFMAGQMGISQTAYSRIEQGNSKIDTERLVKIADLLDVSVMALLELSDKQRFQIKHNQTINGDVTNNGATDDKLWKELIKAKDDVIAGLKNEVALLNKLLEKKNPK